MLNILGDTQLVQACATALQERLDGNSYDILVTAEAKSIPLAHALSVLVQKPYVVLRKVYKPYMGVAVSAETHSITTGQPQVLYLDEKDQNLVVGKRVVLLDDVISTGSTLEGMRQVMEKAGAVVVSEAGIFTEEIWSAGSTSFPWGICRFLRIRQAENYDGSAAEMG